MQVRFLGGHGATSIRAPSGKSIAVGETGEMGRTSVAAMMSLGYKFEAVEEGDTLPTPAPQQVPESVVRQQQQARLQQLKEEHETRMLEEANRVLREREEAAAAAQDDETSGNESEGNVATE